MFHWRFPSPAAPARIDIGTDKSASQDQRVAVRAAIRSLVGKVNDGRGDSMCEVLDLSEQGLLVRLSFTPLIGQAIEVELCGLPRCVAHVRFVEGDKVGMEFVAPQDLDPVIVLVSGEDWTERPPRHKIAMRAVVKLSTGKFPARVLNISQYGIRLQANVAVEPGQTGQVILSGHPNGLSGSVRWVDGNVFGLRFSIPLTPGSLQDYLKL